MRLIKHLGWEVVVCFSDTFVLVNCRQSLFKLSLCLTWITNHSRGARVEPLLRGHLFTGLTVFMF